MIKILVVDDEEIIRKAMGKTFNKYGECTFVEKGLEALKIYQEAFNNEEPFDLIILDYSLEDLSGLDILKEIRDNEKENKIPKIERSKIIMATGNNEVATVKECISAGCNNYILKPLKPKTVAEKLIKLGISPMGQDENESSGENSDPEATDPSSESTGPDDTSNADETNDTDENVSEEDTEKDDKEE